MPRSVPTDSKRDAADNKREARPSAPPRPRRADGGSKTASYDNRAARALLCFLAALIIFVFLKFSDHTGFIGRYIHKALFYCFGMAGYVLPVIFLMCAFKAWSGKLPEKLNVKLVSLLLLADSVFFASKCGEQGGVLGSALNQLFAGILGNAVSWGLAVAGLIAAVYLWWDFSAGEACELAKEVWAVLGEAFKKAGVFIGAALLLTGRLLKSVFSKLMRLAGLLFGDGSEPSAREGGSGDALRSSEGEDSGQYEKSGSLSDFGAQERASASQGRLSGNVDESLDPLGFPKMDSFDKYKDSAKSAEPGGDGRGKESGAVSRNNNMRSRQDSAGGDGNRELMSDPEPQSPFKRAAASEKPYGREAAAQEEAEEQKPDPDIFKYEAADGERQDFTRCQPEYLYKLSAVQRRVLLGLLREKSEQGGSGRGDKPLPKAVNRRHAEGPFSSGSFGGARSAGGNEPPRDKYARSGAGEAFPGENQEGPFQRRQKQESDSGVSAPLSKEDKLRALGIIPRRSSANQSGSVSSESEQGGSASAVASGSVSQSPASLKGMSNEEKRRALGLIPRRSSGSQSGSASAGSEQSGSASAGASGSSPQSPASLKGMSNEEKRRALGIIPRRGSGNQSAPASAGSGPSQAASAGASGSASQSPASLKGMSNEEKRRALGIIPRRGSARQNPEPQPAAAEKAANPGEQSFASISPAALNAMSPAERMKALGLKKRAASEQPDSMEAVKKLRQADGRIAVDSKAALETLGAKGARRPAAAQSRPQEASGHKNAQRESAAAPENRASAPAPRRGSGLRKLTPEEKAAEREKALSLRESYRRQAENRARMLKAQNAGRPQTESDAMGGNDLSDRSPMLAPPADSKKNAFSPDAEPSLLKKNELTPENGRREALSGPEERNEEAADADKQIGGEPAEVRNPKESEGNFYTEGGVFGCDGEPEAFEEAPVLSRSIAEFSAAVGQIKGLSWQAGEDLDDLLGTSETVKAERTGFAAAEAAGAALPRRTAVHSAVRTPERSGLDGSAEPSGESDREGFTENRPAEADEPYCGEADNIFVGNEAADFGAEDASELPTDSLETVREAEAAEDEGAENSTDEYSAEDSTDEYASAEDSTDEYAAEDGSDDYAAESSACGYASAEDNTDEYGGEDDTDEYASAEDSTGDYAAEAAGSSYEGEPAEETEADSVEADGGNGAADSRPDEDEILISRKTAEFPVVFNAETSFAEDTSARPAAEDSLDGEGLSAVSFDSIMPRNRADITNLRPFNIHGSEVFRNPIRAEFFDVRAEEGRPFADTDSASRGGERTRAGMPAAEEPYRSASEAPALSAGSLSVSVNCRPEIVPDIRPTVFVQSAAPEPQAAASAVSAAPHTAADRPAQPAAAPASRPAPSASAAHDALPESSAPAAPAGISADSAAAVHAAPAASARSAGGALPQSREELDSRSAAPPADNAFERGAQERGGVSRSASFGYTGVKRIIGSGNPSGSGSAFGFRSEGGTGASGAGTAAPPSAPPSLRSGSSDSQPSLPAAAGQYYLPSINLLDKAPDSGRPRNFVDKSELLVKTLNSFKVKATVKNVIQGPAVTRYELEPAPGVRVNKITNLSSDIALALAAKNIRIEAPVPGKSAVGIEVPNEETEMVALKDVLDSEAFRGGKGLCCGLGKDITGQVRAADLSRMPHLLVAGTTGSGKSVCINTLILSLIYRFTPRRLQLLMIDPKQVELSIYEGLPHLINLSGEEPGKIIVDPKTASAALKQMVELMEDRYSVFAKNRVRKIEEYNQKHPDKAMPWVVIIIDELADLMMVSSKEVETSICRLAQKARAAGIHMVVATQRPSTDVITGLMKVNIPSRIAFAVSSGVDSRVILDQGGAEHLLGKGDMLFKPVEANEPARIQGAFVNNTEIQRVVDFWTAQEAPDNLIKLEIQDEAVEDSSDKGGSDSDDPMLEEALEVVLRRGQASASMLQTDLRVGYARARRLLNLLEEQGYVGPAEGSKPRKILYTGGSRG